MPENPDDLPWTVRSDSLGAYVVNAHGERMCDTFADVGVNDPVALATRIAHAVNTYAQAVAKLEEIGQAHHAKRKRN